MQVEPNRNFYARCRNAAAVFALQVAAATFLQPGDAIALEITRGPYLQLATPGGVTIRWRTDETTPSRVLYGHSPRELSTVLEDPDSVTDHVMTVGGLQPDRRYYYAILSDAGLLAGGDDRHSFTTAPEPGSQTPTRLWVIGDSGTADEHAEAVRDAFAAYSANRPPDLWLMLGDNAYSHGSDRDYQDAVFDMFPDLLASTVLWPARGNHDESEDYFDMFTLPAAGEAGGVASGTESYYSFDHGSVHLVCLDSSNSDRSADGEMAAWLRNDLAATRADWVIAYWHHPPYSKGSHDSDDDSDMVEMRENLVPILEAGHVDLVLAGHSHDYERSFLIRGHYGTSDEFTDAMKVNGGNGRSHEDGAYHKATFGPEANTGTVYVVLGCSGKTSGGSFDHPAMVTSLEELGSLVIDIAGIRMDARFIDDAGAVLDEFTISKAPKRSARPSPRDRGPRIVFTSPGASPAVIAIDYALPAPGRARITIFGVDGRRVAALVDEERPSGEFQVVWDGKDGAGRRVPSGLYFAELRWAGERSVARLVKVD